MVATGGKKMRPAVLIVDSNALGLVLALAGLASTGLACRRPRPVSTKHNKHTLTALSGRVIHMGLIGEVNIKGTHTLKRRHSLLSNAFEYITKHLFEVRKFICVPLRNATLMG
jgi:hypothetical protein